MENIDARFKEMKKKFAVNKAKQESEYYYNDLKPRIEYKTEVKELPTCNLITYKPTNICDVCGKVLKNSRGVAIHKGKVHKNKDYPVVKAEQIKESKPKAKSTIKYKNKPYYCNKCKRFHKYKFRGKPSKTHKTCFKHIVKYKDEYTQSELFKLGFKKEWKRESNRSELQKRKGTKQ